jgi:hypothetical protein
MLRAREQRILEAVCEALVPPALDDVAPSPTELREFVVRFVAELPPRSVLGFRGGLWLLELSSLARTLRPLAHHDRARRHALLVSCASSRLGVFRLAIKVVSGLSLMALYAAPPVRLRLGLPA